MKFTSSLTWTTKPALSQGSDITRYFSVTLSQRVLFQREYLCFNPHFSYLQVWNLNLGSLLREFQVLESADAGNLGKLGRGEGFLVIPEITPLECYLFLGLVIENHLDKKKEKKTHQQLKKNPTSVLSIT